MGRGKRGERFLVFFTFLLLAPELCSCFQLAATNHAQRTWTVRPREGISSLMITPCLGKHSMGSKDRHPLSARWFLYRLRSSSVATHASGEEGNQGPGGRDDDQSQQREPADSSDTNEHTSMELRDFRARLLAKGLDGWGAQDDGGGNGSAEPVSGDDERWAHPLVRPELGCLVLANESMFTQRQQYFYHAVILVIQHGLDGTVGLILNRPTTFTMGDVCKGDLYRVPGMEDNVLYMGGDVAGARDDGLDVVNLLHGREDVPGMEVVKGLRLGGLKEALDLIAKGEAKAEEFKFFSRYAGWGPGQLEAEVLAKDWVLAACDLPSILQNQNHPDQPGHFWNDIVSRLRRHREKGEEAQRRRSSS